MYENMSSSADVRMSSCPFWSLSSYFSFEIMDIGVEWMAQLCISMSSSKLKVVLPFLAT